MKSKAFQNSARGEQCTFGIAGVCNGNEETTVFCHLPSETGGMGFKSTDLCAAYGCSSCHDVIDNRVWNADYVEDRHFYNMRALVRTYTRLWEKELIQFKGAK